MQPDADLEGLYLALEARPDDVVALLALADRLEEAGEGAAGLRWAAAHGRVPYRHRRADRLRYHVPEWHEGWLWWVSDQERIGWGYPPSCVLPHTLWRGLNHTFKYDPTTFKQYATVRGAYAELLAAWDGWAEGEE